MNTRRLSLLFTCLWCVSVPLFGQAPIILTIFPEEDPLTPADYRLVWPTSPGQRYEVQQSPDLLAWEALPGFPLVATGSTFEWPFLAGNGPRFFQGLSLDEPPPAPAGMALIPAGSFQMGDTFTDWLSEWGENPSLPVHPVQVGAFYMDKFEVTKALWDEVYTWALAHGYRFDNRGSSFGGVNLSKGASHPVHSVTWYDMVKWCNARSEKEGLTPCYYTAANQSSAYRSGNLDLANDAVKWGANGYRLPTEAEWEKAARGGLQGQRFSWGDTATHSQANYSSEASFTYDVSPTRGFHPIYAVGDWPYTSPVGSFLANGYGLFDMAGNVKEWCWDWHEAYSSGSQTDPHGPMSGSIRVLRGGNWSSFADALRCASRDYGFAPSVLDPGRFGFRCVRGL